MKIKRWEFLAAAFVLAGFVALSADAYLLRRENDVAGTIYEDLDTSGGLYERGPVSASSATVRGDMSVSGVTTVSTTTVTGGIRPGINTKAQLAALTSTTTGQLMICSDCTRSYVCMSSGTVGPDSFVVAVETATIVGGPKTKCQ